MKFQEIQGLPDQKLKMCLRKLKNEEDLEKQFKKYVTYIYNGKIILR